MRISDWSSDVCSSDLATALPVMSTAPAKSLPAFARVTLPVPASNVATPPTLKAPLCAMPPPLVVTDRLPTPLSAGALKLAAPPDSAAKATDWDRTRVGEGKRGLEQVRHVVRGG